MTCIAYRDGILAADSLGTRGDTRAGPVKKVHRAKDGTIAAAAGDAGGVQAFFRWLDNPRGARPTLSNFSGISVSPRGEIRKWDESGNWFVTTQEWFALGCGLDIAMGAMEMGATAEQAVAAAIRHNVFCEGPIQIERVRLKRKR